MPYYCLIIIHLWIDCHFLSISYLSIRQRAWPQSTAALSSLLHHSWHISRRICGRSSAANRAPEICQRHQHGPWKGHHGAPVYDPLQCLYRSQNVTKCHKMSQTSNPDRHSLTHWLIDSLTHWLIDHTYPIPQMGWEWMRKWRPNVPEVSISKHIQTIQIRGPHGPSEVQLGVGHWACSVIVLSFCRFSSCSPDHDSTSRASAVELDTSHHDVSHIYIKHHKRLGMTKYALGGYVPRSVHCTCTVPNMPIYLRYTDEHWMALLLASTAISMYRTTLDLTVRLQGLAIHIVDAGTIQCYCC